MSASVQATARQMAGYQNAITTRARFFNGIKPLAAQIMTTHRGVARVRRLQDARRDELPPPEPVRLPPPKPPSFTQLTEDIIQIGRSLIAATFVSISPEFAAGLRCFPTGRVISRYYRADSAMFGHILLCGRIPVDISTSG